MYWVGQQVLDAVVCKMGPSVFPGSICCGERVRECGRAFTVSTGKACKRMSLESWSSAAWLPWVYIPRQDWGWDSPGEGVNPQLPLSEACILQEVNAWLWIVERSLSQQNGKWGTVKPTVMALRENPAGGTQPNCSYSFHWYLNPSPLSSTVFSILLSTIN